MAKFGSGTKAAGVTIEPPRRYSSWNASKFELHRQIANHAVRLRASLASVALILISITWAHANRASWGSPVVDFGREVYTGWRLYQGEVLYRDLVYLHGPLSPYLNAFWFSLWGDNLDTLTFANLCLLSATAVLLFFLLRHITSDAAVFFGLLSFFFIFALGHTTPLGNYNFITPYSHELTHGILLSLLLLSSLFRFAATRSRRALWGACCINGLLLLGKLELFLAGSVTLVAATLLAAWGEARSGRQLARASLCALLFFSAPPLAAFTLLELAMPLGEAAEAVLSPLTNAFRGGRAAGIFYGQIGGWDSPFSHLLESASWLAVGATYLTLCAVLDRRFKHWGKERYVFCAGMGPLGVYVTEFAALQVRTSTLAAPRMLPLLLACTLAIAVKRFADARALPTADIRVTQERRILFLTFSLCLLAKICLNTRFTHYGFALALPGALAAIAIVVDWLPNHMERRGLSGTGIRIGACSLIISFVSLYFQLSIGNTAQKQHRLDTPRGSLAAAPAEGQALSGLLRYIQDELPQNSSVAFFPEGGLLNFLSRRANGTPYASIMPVETEIFSLEKILSRIASHPPHYIALVQNDLREYGVAGLGVDFALPVHRWILANYRFEKRFSSSAGSRPFTVDLYRYIGQAKMTSPPTTRLGATPQ
ncbi:MAG: hypothetical protein KDD69_11625 [Bdellovibrionales bacterium]|nr:hypothetical protein [Bdellovibrionales bacterium]